MLHPPRLHLLAATEITVKTTVSEKHCQWKLSVKSTVSEKNCQWKALSVKRTVSEKHCQWKRTVSENNCQWKALSVKRTVSEKHCQWKVLSKKHCQWKALLNWLPDFWLQTVGRPTAPVTAVQFVSCVISFGTSEQRNEPTHRRPVARRTRLHFGDLTCTFTHSWSMRKSIQQNSYWPSVMAEFKLERTAHGKIQCKGWPNIWFVRK